MKQEPILRWLITQILKFHNFSESQSISITKTYGTKFDNEVELVLREEFNLLGSSMRKLARLMHLGPLYEKEL